VEKGLEVAWAMPIYVGSGLDKACKESRRFEWVLATHEHNQLGLGIFDRGNPATFKVLGSKESFASASVGVGGNPGSLWHCGLENLHIGLRISH
jgi:hypothetical protein